LRRHFDTQIIALFFRKNSMARSFHFRVRKLHRYLGVILGIQFLFWTVGGIYFSWSNMDEIHGDLNRNPLEMIPVNSELISPSLILKQLSERGEFDSVKELKLIAILGKPFYQIHYFPDAATTTDHSAHARMKKPAVQLADAYSGVLRGPLTESEAVEIAKSAFNGDSKVTEVKMLRETSSHHEYRSNPLPAFAISFDHPSRTTVFISAELGTIQKIRNQKWRIFDFLWMMHTMDYEGRDNFGNLLLRTFSIFGLLTIASGFILFYVSSGVLRRKKKHTGKFK